jgi:hypothetical protein
MHSESLVIVPSWNTTRAARLVAARGCPGYLSFALPAPCFRAFRFAMPSLIARR